MRKSNTSRYAFGTLVLALVVFPATLLMAADSDADSSTPTVIVGKPTDDGRFAADCHAAAEAIGLRAVRRCEPKEFLTGGHVEQICRAR